VVSVDEAGSHVCSSPRLSFDCPACRHPFPSQEDLESHIVNMWCPKLRICDSTPSVRDIQVRIYSIFNKFGDTQCCGSASFDVDPDPLNILMSILIRIQILT
jgi:hypothetical protein